MVTYSQYARSLNDKQLVSEWEQLWECIHVAECFSSRDILMEYVLAQELEDRGFQLNRRGEVIRVREPKSIIPNLERIS